jgi:hypothetical protein
MAEKAAALMRYNNPRRAETKHESQTPQTGDLSVGWIWWKYLDPGMAPSREKA